MADSNEFRSRFQELVDELDIKNKTIIAKEIGITYSNFVKAYNYGILPTVMILVRIADYFNVSIDYLVGITDNENFVQAESKTTFQQRLRELIQKKDISTVYELSKLTHIHRNNIAQWLKKNYIPTIEDLIIIANVFKVSVDYLIGRTDEDSPY